MTDEKRIDVIIDSFRSILLDIFSLSQHRDFVSMIFLKGHEKAVRDRIDAYFDEELVNNPRDEHDLEVMRDGVHHLMDKISQSNPIVKKLLYEKLFYDENYVSETEVLSLFGSCN